MKLNNKSISSAAKAECKTRGENDRKRKGWRQIWLRLAAIFLIIIFLAAECATLLPVE